MVEGNKNKKQFFQTTNFLCSKKSTDTPIKPYNLSVHSLGINYKCNEDGGEMTATTKSSKADQDITNNINYNNLKQLSKDLPTTATTSSTPTTSMMNTTTNIPTRNNFHFNMNVNVKKPSPLPSSLPIAKITNLNNTKRTYQPTTDEVDQKLQNVYKKSSSPFLQRKPSEKKDSVFSNIGECKVTFY